MSSRRKSTTPKHSDQSERTAAREGGAAARSDDSDDDIMQAPRFPDAGAGGGASATAAGGASTEGGYECKYCSFRTSDLNLFTNHVDAQHPTIVTNTSYVCLECDYATKSYDTLQVHNARCHPGEDSFTRTMVTRNNQTIFQQSVNDLTFDGSFVKTEESPALAALSPALAALSPAHGTLSPALTALSPTPSSGRNALSPTPAPTGPAHIALSQTPIMRRGRGERPSSPPPADIIKVESDSEEEDYDSKEMPVLSPAPTAPATPLTPVTAVTTATPAAPPLVAVNQNFVVNGAGVQVKGGGGVLAPGTLAQVLTALTGQTQNSSPQTQLLIPVSSIPTYSPNMDHNLLLISAFNRFPYPSVAEILGLSSQTKFSEEQIKVWFSAQRLKHGVSWTPEEVEEARRKKVNGAVQAPPTIAVIPAALAGSLSGNGLQSLFQTCHIVGQPGLVLTQLGANANGTALPVTLTVTPSANPAPDAASDPAPNTASDPALNAAADHSPNKPKKSKEQLAELKASYGRRPFATEAEISRLMQVTKLSKRAIKKWFSDTRYNQRNSREHHGPPPPERAGPECGAGAEPRRGPRGGAAIVIDSSDETESALALGDRDGIRSCRSRSPADLRVKFRHAFPDFTLQKFKEKTTEQRAELERSFRRSTLPSEEELSRLRASTKLTRRELDAWFTDRRKLETADLPQSSDERGSAPLQQGASCGGGRRAVKKNPEQLQTLKRAFVRSQWPTAAEYDRLSADTGLPRSDIINWFGDTRYSAKNSALKWYYLYHSGKGEEALNGSGAKKKPRKRFRGWSRRRRPKRTTPDYTGVKVKSGRWFLKDYYLRHRALSESDLDDLVSKSGLSYEVVRDWFKQVQTREDQGLQAFSHEDSTEEEDEHGEQHGADGPGGDAEHEGTQEHQEDTDAEENLEENLEEMEENLEENQEENLEENLEEENLEEMEENQEDNQEEENLEEMEENQEEENLEEMENQEEGMEEVEEKPQTDEGGQWQTEEQSQSQPVSEQT